MNFAALLPKRPEPPIDQWVKDRLKDPKLITWAEWETFRANSYEQEMLHPHLDNDALVRLTRYYIEQCGRRERYPAITYNEAVIHVLAPLLLERLEGLPAGLRRETAAAVGARPAAAATP